MKPALSLLFLSLFSLSGRAHADPPTEDPSVRLRRCADHAEADLDTRDAIDAAYADCAARAQREAAELPTGARALEIQDRIAFDILREVDEDSDLHRQAKTTLARNRRLTGDLKRRARAAERAAMRKLRTRVLFGEVAPDTLQPFRHATSAAAGPSCDRLALLAAPPPVRARDGFDLSVAVNGEVCHDETFDSPTERKLAAICGDQNVLRPGENNVSVTLSRNINRRVGTRIDPETLRVLPIYSNTAGKRLASARWRCTR